jgi:hypothetical protein
VPPATVRAPRRASVFDRLATLALLAVALMASPRSAVAVPSFARQTGMPCSQCHTLSFGPALTAYGRQFKLNGYAFAGGERPLPLALMIQGGYSRTATAQPAPPAPGFSPGENLSVDQVSLFISTRLSDHWGLFSQSTYSGEKRHYNWDNTDLRYARPTTLFGTDAVVGLSINNNPTVQDLWTSTPAWGYPYITSPLVPAPGPNPVINGALAQLVVGASAYAMLHERLYLEAGGYKGLSDRWLNNLGLYPDNSPHVNGVAPYWRAAYQFNSGQRREHYFSVGTYGLDVRMQPDVTVPDTNRFADIAFDATYQYTPEDGPGAILLTTSFTHEKQDLAASFAAAGSASATNHLNAWRFDLAYTYRQTWSAGFGLFDFEGSPDRLLYAPAALTGSNSGSPDTRGYIVQLECVPFGKQDSWAAPWVNLRVGVQYTGYVRFNGGTSNYDGFGRSASDNDSLFVFLWMAF